MEEELNEDEIGKSIEALIHHVDNTKPNYPTTELRNDPITSTPKQNFIRRYWHTIGDGYSYNSPFQKINPKRTDINPPNIKKLDNSTKNKHEKLNVTLEPQSSEVQSVNQTYVPRQAKRPLQVTEANNVQIVELESSDEDEVIEVVLPPKPTITIESSDEDDLQVIKPATVKQLTSKPSPNKKPGDDDREVSASPVPSVVSSISDEFIRSDCIALNISSRRVDRPTFDFSLHGTDLLDQGTPAKKRKKKKNKDKNNATSTPVVNVTATPEKANADECFATPKTKSRNKRKKNKATVETKPADRCSDVDKNEDKNKNSYTVSDKGIPNADVYESDSNQSAIVEVHKPDNEGSTKLYIVDVIGDRPDSKSTSTDNENTLSVPKQSNENVESNQNNKADVGVVDLTDNCEPLLSEIENVSIDDNLVIANVTGLSEMDEVSVTENTAPIQDDNPKLGSTKVPAILSEDVDFDNLKGTNEVSSRRYSLATLRADMEKFYNESWGGEDFNHREIQNSMSRDKSLWAIDPKDRFPTPAKRKICGYCDRAGHSAENCRMRYPVCHMCGISGHHEPRCPRKICVNCGSPNHMYSSTCRHCTNWPRVTCPECGQRGHPYSHCPDVWRRYHSTIDNVLNLEQNRQTKKHYQLFCSGCTRRGHLVHACRTSLPFSGLPINSPYVAIYRPIYLISENRSAHVNPINNSGHISKSCQPIATVPPIHSPKIVTKRQSKSPTAHTNHLNKRRNTGPLEESDSGKNQNDTTPKELTECVEKNNETHQQPPNSVDSTENTEPAPDYIPIMSSNHDKKGQIIQDNEVSDTSDVATTARIYVTKQVIDDLKTAERQVWLQETTQKHNVTVTYTEINSFLSIEGKAGDQEAFLTELRASARPSVQENSNTQTNIDKSINKNGHDDSLNIPKNRDEAIRKITQAFASLNQNLGNPNKMFKELTYLQNHHTELLNQKIISSKQVANNRDNINQTLKKLNMVLLGQAGLADGFTHLDQLRSIQGKLTNFKETILPKQLRQEIGQHYHCIFSATRRDDYKDLLTKYHNNGCNVRLPMIKKGENSFKRNSNCIQMKQFKPKLNTNHKMMQSNEPGNVFAKMLTQRVIGATLQARVDTTRSKLVFYNHRLQQAQPSNATLKTTRLNLLRKLHVYISTLDKMAEIPSNEYKKMRKVQRQAQGFLTKV